MQDKILFYILSYDVWFYLSHLLLHTKYGYAWIHKHHHAVNYKTMRYSDAYVGHTLESPFQGMLFPLIFIEFEYHNNIHDHTLIPFACNNETCNVGLRPFSRLTTLFF